jgi:hypothetical protein
MGRVKKSSAESELEIIDLKRKHDEEKKELLEQPKDDGKKIDVNAVIQWQGLQQIRYDAIMAIHQSMIEIQQLIRIKTKEGVDVRELVALYREQTAHASNLYHSIDKAIPGFYDPKTERPDNQMEIVIRYETE